MTEQSYMLEDRHQDIIHIRKDQGIEVLRIDNDGRLFWKGCEVETDEDFRAAMLELKEALVINMQPYTRPVGENALREELRAIHSILMCPAEATPSQPSDTATVKLLKDFLIVNQKAISSIANEALTNALHPEFGYEWREPEGVIYKTIRDTEIRTLEEAARTLERRAASKNLEGGCSFVIAQELRRMAQEKRNKSVI